MLWKLNRWSRSQRAIWGAVLAANALILAQPASAEQRPIGAPPIEEEKPPELIPYRRDHVGGHFQIGVSGNLVLPFGSVSKDLGVKNRSGLGGGGVVDMSFGLDRNVALGVYGEMSWLGESGSCRGCSASTLGAGGFVRYHLAQGLKFDPWLSYGVGFMTFGADTGTTSLHYAGLDWLRLTFGANWYTSSKFILGPVVSLNVGHLTERPPGETVGGPLVRGLVGLRLSFDTPGRLKGY